MDGESSVQINQTREKCNAQIAHYDFFFPQGWQDVTSKLRIGLKVTLDKSSFANASSLVLAGP